MSTSGIFRLGGMVHSLLRKQAVGRRQHAVQFIDTNVSSLLSRLSGSGISIKSLFDIASSAKTLKEEGLYIRLSKVSDREDFLSSLNILTVTYSLSQAGLLGEAGKIADFLEKVIKVHRKDGKVIPAGELNLAAAMKQYDEAISGLSAREQGELETAYILAAVKDNNRVASHELMADNYEAMFELLDGVTVNSIERASRSIVDTAQRLWPGGNPTLLLYREDHGDKFLVPVAVALNQSIIRQGEKVLDKKLGQYAIPIRKDSWNPYVKNFLRGKMTIDRNMTRETFKIVCEGFIDHQFKGGILGSLFFGISFPGGENSLVFVPLVVTDPLTRNERKVGIMAILKKGFYTQGQLREVGIFARSSARTLATIEWINELMQAKAEASAYAQEKALSAGRLKQALRELETAQGELVRKERLAAAGELAANISHASKNSLRIAGALVDKIARLGITKRILHEILEKKAALGFQPGNGLELLSRTERETMALNRALAKELKENDRIVRGMLSFAKEEGVAKENIPLARFIKEREAGFMTQAEEGGIVYYAANKIGDTDGVWMSPLDLGDILKNLVGNAIEALSRSRKSEKVIQLLAVRNPNLPEIVSIKVVDNGPGFPAKELGSVFAESRRGRSVKGTGLGLPEVRKKVERNGGEISVTSEEGSGTTFEIKLPWVRVSAAIATGKSKPVIPRALAQKIEVVFADDKVENRELTHETLTDMGFSVSSYVRAEDAFAAIKEGRAFPELVVVDQDFGKGRMPGHVLIRNLAAFYKAKGWPLPRFAIFSGDLPPARGEVAETVKQFKVKWIAKGADAAEFRGEVSEAAVGEVRNVVSFYPPDYLDENPFRVFARGICHKMNNGLQALQYLEFDEPEVLDARHGFVRYYNSMISLAGLAYSIAGYSSLAMGEVALRCAEFSDNLIIEDDYAIAGWDALAPEKRHLIAIAILKYYDKISAPARRIMDLLNQGSLNQQEVGEVFGLNDKIMEVNDAFGLKSEAGEEWAQFFRLLEEI